MTDLLKGFLWLAFTTSMAMLNLFEGDTGWGVAWIVLVGVTGVSFGVELAATVGYEKEKR